MVLCFWKSFEYFWLVRWEMRREREVWLGKSYLFGWVSTKRLCVWLSLCSCFAFLFYFSFPFCTLTPFHIHIHLLTFTVQETTDTHLQTTQHKSSERENRWRQHVCNAETYTQHIHIKRVRVKERERQRMKIKLVWTTIILNKQVLFMAQYCCKILFNFRVESIFYIAHCFLYLLL